MTPDEGSTPNGEERVVAEEICLFCNLYDLFTRYSVFESGPAMDSNEVDRIL